MADNINVKESTDSSARAVAAEEIGGALLQRVKLAIGVVDTDNGDVSATNPMPVVLPSATVAALQGILTALQGTLTVGGAVTANGPMTDAQLRATPVPVSITGGPSGGLTDIQLRAAAVPVSGPVTDSQLRATAIPVSASALPLPAGAATQVTLASVLTALQGTLNVSATVGVTYADRSGTIATGGTAQTIAAANAGRRGLFIQNNSSADLWVNSLAAAVQGQPSLRLPAGALYEFPSTGVPVTAISIVGATTGQAFSAREY